MSHCPVSLFAAVTVCQGADTKKHSIKVMTETRTVMLKTIVVSLLIQTFVGLVEIANYGFYSDLEFFKGKESVSNLPL